MINSWEILEDNVVATKTRVNDRELRNVESLPVGEGKVELGEIIKVDVEGPNIEN